jgi:hypothetical protein
VTTTTVPDLIEPVVGFRKWGIVRGHLSSPFIPLAWREREVHARCYPANRTLVFGHGWLDEPHDAPHPECQCGVYAYHRPPPDGPIPYLDRVAGIVALWGRMEVHADGMRAQHARIEALAVRPHLGSQQERRVRRIAAGLGVDVVDHRELGVAAADYGRPLPRELIPEGRPAPRASGRR